MTQKMYFSNPLTTEFVARIVDMQSTESDQIHVILDQTYFYPTGGGQSHDLGWIGGLPVVDVYTDNGDVIHVVQGNDLIKGEIQAEVNQVRRWRNMQAHTGQHLLSAAFIHALEAETFAVKMNPDAPSTVDIACSDLTTQQIAEVEMLSNQVIFENRPIKSYFLAPDDPKLESLRRAVKADKVSGDVRIVEIEGWDMSACAGTHVPYTGMLGLLKILKAENYKGGSRIHFVLGYEALSQFRHFYQVVTDVSNLLSAGTSDVVNLVQKLQDERQTLSKQLAQQETALLLIEKEKLLSTAIMVGERQLLRASFVERSNNSLKTLANLITDEPKIVLVLANQ